MYNDACFYCLRKRRKIYVIIEKKVHVAPQLCNGVCRFKYFGIG